MGWRCGFKKKSKEDREVVQLFFFFLQARGQTEFFFPTMSRSWRKKNLPDEFGCLKLQSLNQQKKKIPTTAHHPPLSPSTSIVHPSIYRPPSNPSIAHHPIHPSSTTHVHPVHPSPIAHRPSPIAHHRITASPIQKKANENHDGWSFQKIKKNQASEAISKGKRVQIGLRKCVWARTEQVDLSGPGTLFFLGFSKSCRCRRCSEPPSTPKTQSSRCL